MIINKNSNQSQLLKIRRLIYLKRFNDITLLVVRLNKTLVINDVTTAMKTFRAEQRQYSILITRSGDKLKPIIQAV